MLTLKEKLDYETQKRHYLRLEVRFDVGFTAQTTVIIEVKDDNDVVPDLFVQPSLSILTPNFPIDSFVSLIQVNDVDTEKSYSYSILGGDHVNPLFLVESSGLIKTKRCITDADVNLYELNVQVDDGKHKASRIATVRVRRSEDKSFQGNCGLDCREFGHPSTYTFTQGLYTRTIKENAPRNTFIQQVRVPAFEDATYTLSAEANGVFIIDRNGTITTLVPLDYEKAPYYSFTVTASLPTPVTPQIANMQAGVIVRLENEDDESPILVSAPSTVSVSELTKPNAAIGCIKVTDKDTNLANLIYSLTGGNNLFTIDQDGEIRLKESLQANAGQNVSLSFEVSDGKNTPLSGSFDILVVDENDKVPIFNEIIYEASLSETSIVGTSVTTVVATDADTNSQIMYNLVKPSTIFAISPSSGVITLKSNLDYEVSQVHEFLVSATDRSIFSQTIVKVNVIDANDTAPVLAVNPVIGRVSEYALVGATIVQILASDPDSTDVLTYTLDQASDIFMLDPSTGSLSLQKRLYQFREVEYTLPFTVRDSQNNAIQGDMVVKIQRSTINPCPDFVGAHSIELLENATIGTFITSIRNQTENYYSVLQYSVYDDSRDKMFAIDLDGKITLAKSLDYEKQTIHSLTVDAYDTVRRFNSTIIFFVKVKDVNEFPPVIAETSMTISELAPSGTPVGTVSVTDADGSSAIKFSLGQDADSQAFAIDPDTGLVTVNTSFNTGSKSQYPVNVCASDGVKKVCKEITITVSNVNDKAPTFVQYNESYVIEKPTVGMSVGTLTATDTDGDDLTYSFMEQNNPDTEKYFSIAQGTGEIKIKEVPTAQVYTLSVCASDSRFKVCVPISIRVPSSVPVFNPDKYGISLPDNSALDTNVIRVYATDITGNSNIRYSILSGNSNEKFKINAESGMIQVNKIQNDGTIYFKMKVKAENTFKGSSAEVMVVVVLTPAQSPGTLTGTPSAADGDSLVVNFTLSDFDHANVKHYMVVAQEVGPYANNTQNTDRLPVSWYFATTQLGYQYYPFYVAKIPKDLGTTKRKRRAVSIPQ